MVPKTGQIKMQTRYPQLKGRSPLTLGRLINRFFGQTAPIAARPGSPVQQPTLASYGMSIDQSPNLSEELLLASFDQALIEIDRSNNELCIPDRTCGPVEKRLASFRRFYQENKTAVASSYEQSGYTQPEAFLRQLYLGSQFLAVAATTASPLAEELKLEAFFSSLKGKADLVLVAKFGETLEQQGFSLERLAVTELIANIVLEALGQDGRSPLLAPEGESPENYQAFVEGLNSATQQDRYWQLFTGMMQEHQENKAALAEKKAEEAAEEALYTKRLERRRSEQRFWQKKATARREEALELMRAIMVRALQAKVSLARERLSAIILADPTAANRPRFQFIELMITLGKRKQGREEGLDLDRRLMNEALAA